MSNDFEVEVENHHKVIRPDEPVIELVDSESFTDFMEQLVAKAEAGEPMTQVIAEAVMALFQPGFVIIASPIMEDTGDGTLVPESVAVALSTRNTLTPSNLAILLAKLAAEVTENIEKITEELGEDSDSE